MSSGQSIRYPAFNGGFSYVEVLLCSVIFSILLVSAVRLAGNLGRSQIALTESEWAKMLAVDMIEEIKLKDYEDPSNTNEFGPGVDETIFADRIDFDDIDDYDGWNESPPQRRNAQPYPQCDNLTRTIAVRYVEANDFTQTAGSDEGFKEITITVENPNQIYEEQKYVIADVPRRF